MTATDRKPGTRSRNSILTWIAIVLVGGIAALLLFREGAARDPAAPASAESDTAAPTREESVQEPGSDERARDATSVPAPERTDHVEFGIQFVWADDLRPAPFIPAVARLVTTGGSEERSVRGDGQGRVRFERPSLPAALLLEIAGQGIVEVDCVADEYTRVPVRRGATLAGRVLDPTGSPAPDAEIVLRSGAETTVHEVHEDGSFRLEGLQRGEEIHARHADFVVSRTFVVPDSMRAPGFLELRLRPGPCAVLEGTVRDVRGRPVVGAFVNVTFPRPGTVRTWTVSKPALGAQAARTDARGEFRLLGLPLGPLEVEASAAGHGRSRTDLVLEDDVELELVLPDAASVAGVVREEGTGRALSGVSVVGRSVDSRELFALTESSADGAYVLNDAPAGEVKVVAEDPTHAVHVAVVEVLAGQRTEHEIALTPVERVVAGWLSTTAGAPLPDWVVGLGKEPGLWERSTVTDPDGHFRIGVDPSDPSDPSESFYLEAMPLDRGAQVVLSKGPLPAEELGGHHAVRSDLVPSAFLFGRVEFDDGASGPREGLVLVGAPGAGTWFPFPLAGDGSFAAGPLAPGDYELRVLGPGILPVVRGPFELGPDDQRDCGTVAVGRAGFLLVRMASGASVESTSVRITVTPLDEPGEPAFDGLLRGSLLELTDVTPGTYEVRATSRGEVVDSTVNNVAAGEWTHVSLR